MLYFEKRIHNRSKSVPNKQKKVINVDIVIWIKFDAVTPLNWNNAKKG